MVWMPRSIIPFQIHRYHPKGRRYVGRPLNTSTTPQRANGPRAWKADGDVDFMYLYNMGKGSQFHV
jgi:hypothetical protein